MKHFAAYSLVLVAITVPFSSFAGGGGGCSAPSNANCSGATSLSVNASLISGNTCSGLESGESTGCSAPSTQSVWYRFNATASTLFLTIENTGGCYVSTAVWPASAGCPPTASATCRPLSCQDGAYGSGVTDHELDNLTVGAGYLVQVMYTPGAFCGNDGSFNIGIATTPPVTTIENPAPLSTCASPSGVATAYPALNQTASNVAATANAYVNPSFANTVNEVYSACFTFTALNNYAEFQNVVNSNCPVGGNVDWMNWEVYDASCGLVACGSLSGDCNAGANGAMCAVSGLTCGADYRLAYTYEIPSCTHTQHYPFVTFNGSCILPVEVVYFNARAAGNAVTVEWKTASESNNKYFTVLHSPDGTQYTPIGKVRGAGNSSTDNYYQFVDHDPVPGFNYYQLSQTDYDGKTTYFNITLVDFESSEFAINYIQTASGAPAVVVSFVSPVEGEVMMEFINLTGQVIWSVPLAAQMNSNEVAVMVGDIVPGFYFLRLRSGDSVVQQKFCKY